MAPRKKAAPANGVVASRSKAVPKPKSKTPPKPKSKAAKQPKITSVFAEKKQSVPRTKKVKVLTPEQEARRLKLALTRFNGMTEEEVSLRGLPDHLREGLDVVFIGINPSLAAAYSGKYYDGPGNHFWQALFLSGFVPQPMGPEDDVRMNDLGIGFTNVVARTTRGIADLSRKEIADGAKVLREKLARFKPKVAVFNGKSIYEVYSGCKKFMFGKQPEQLEGTETWVWVMPSTSALVAQLPRAVDKVPFFAALKKFLDFLKGVSSEPHEEEIVFANVVLKNCPRKVKQEVKQEPIEAEEEGEA